MMIRHIVFFTAGDGHSAREIQFRLNRLKEIPHANNLEVSLNMKSDPLSDEIDVVVYAEFKDQAGLNAYRNHPVYEQVTREVKPLRKLRFSANVEAEG